MTREQADSARDIFIPRYYRPGASARTTLTRERIRQIETIAIPKFRRELVKRGISKDDGNNFVSSAISAQVKFLKQNRVACLPVGLNL